jgi:hypothetical protein
MAARSLLQAASPSGLLGLGRCHKTPATFTYSSQIPGQFFQTIFDFLKDGGGMGRIGPIGQI